MSSSLKKFFSAFSIFFAILLFSGCGQKSADTGKKSDAPENTAKENDSYAKSLPAATGNPDDAVSAILSEIESEESDVMEEEKAAAASIDDSVETDNFSKIYDENEF